MTTTDQIQVLYITYFGRPADPQGLNYWVQNGASQELIADGFATTPEYASTTAGKSITQVINSFYVNLFGRNGDTAGVAFWTQKVNDYLLGKPGGISLQQVGRFIADGALIQPNGSPDKVALQSKITASTNWTTTVAANVQSANNYNGSAANAVGVQYLVPVVSAATIPTAAQTQAAIGTLPPAGAYTLTTSPDTATAQVFLAPQAYTPGGTDLVNTLQNEDRLTGNSVAGATSLTGDIGNVNDNGSDVIAPQITNVDAINIAFTATRGSAPSSDAGQTLDFQDISGTEIANITRISGNLRQSFRNLKGEVATLGIANTSEQAKVAITYLNNELSAANNTVTLNLNNASLADNALSGDRRAALTIEATWALGGDLQNQIETYNINTVGAASTVATLATGLANSYNNQVIGERPQSININAGAGLAIGTLRWLSNRVETESADTYNPAGTSQVGGNGRGFIDTQWINNISVQGTTNVTLANVGTWDTTLPTDPDSAPNFTLNASTLVGDLTANLTNASASAQSSFTGGLGSDRFYVSTANVLATVSGGAGVDSLTVQSNAGHTIAPAAGSAGLEYLNIVQAPSASAQTWEADVANGGFQFITLNNQDADALDALRLRRLANLNGQRITVQSTGAAVNGDPVTTQRGAVDIEFSQAASVAANSTATLALGSAADNRLVSDAFSWQNFTRDVRFIDRGTGTVAAANLNLIVNSAGEAGTSEARIEVLNDDFSTLTTLTSEASAQNTVSIGFQQVAGGSTHNAADAANSLNSTTYNGAAYLGTQRVTFGGATQKSFNITTGGANNDRVDLSFLTTDASRTAAGFAASSNLLNTVINMGGGTGDELILSATLADPREVLVADPTYDGYFQNWSGIETLTVNNRNGIVAAGTTAFVGLDQYAQANNSGLNTINFNDVNSALTVGFRFTNSLNMNVDAATAAKTTTITSYGGPQSNLQLNVDATGTQNQNIVFESTGAGYNNTVNVVYNNIDDARTIDSARLSVVNGSLDLVDFNTQTATVPNGTDADFLVVTANSWTAAGLTTTYDFVNFFSKGLNNRHLSFDAVDEANASGLTILGSLDGRALGIDNSIVGSQGNDTITSGGFNDTLEGGAGNDAITYVSFATVANAVTVVGGAGNDTVNLSSLITGETALVYLDERTGTFTSGNDTYVGGAGDETIVAGQGADSINGGAGNDTYSAQGLNGILDGGTTATAGVVINLGSTTLTAAQVLAATDLKTSGGNTSVASNTVAYVGTNASNGVGISTIVDTLSGVENAIGSAGTDYIVGSNNSNVLVGDDGADFLAGRAGRDTILGGIGNDAVEGNEDEDLIYGGEGGDSIQAGRDSDTVYGGEGNDIISGGSTGDDLLFGDNGSDNITGVDGNDTLVGGNDNDFLSGGLGIDVFSVDLDVDTISDLGLGGSDILLVSANAFVNATVAGAGWVASSMTSNQGSYTNAILTTDGYSLDLSLATGPGGYTLVNLSSPASLFGSVNSDAIIGGGANDTIAGGIGSDVMSGLGGSNTFIQRIGDSCFSSNQFGWDFLDPNGALLSTVSKVTFANGVDIITDFNSASDKIDASVASAVDAFAAPNLRNATIGNYFARGSWNASQKYFLADQSGQDILFYVSQGSQQESSLAFGNSSTVLMGGASGFNPLFNII